MPQDNDDNDDVMPVGLHEATLEAEVEAAWRRGMLHGMALACRLGMPLVAESGLMDLEIRTLADLAQVDMDDADRSPLRQLLWRLAPPAPPPELQRARAKIAATDRGHGWRLFWLTGVGEDGVLPVRGPYIPWPFGEDVLGASDLDHLEITVVDVPEDHTAQGEVAFTSALGGSPEKRRWRLCQCTACGLLAPCEPTTDFYVDTVGCDPASLLCEACHRRAIARYLDTSVEH